MFSSGPNYTKLKTHLRLAINRLKLLEKKKTELTQKARKEIADYIQIGKYERAKIRVEHIIREDYLVEAMEIVEMFCDLILARFGIITQMKALDEGIAEAVASVLWVAPRLQSDVQELKVISDILTTKYSKPYADACRSEEVTTVNEKLKQKLSIQSPPKILVEKYMIEIAKNYNLHYQPDPNIMKEEPTGMMDAFLVDLSDKNNLDGAAPQPPGFIDFPQAPKLPIIPTPFAYPKHSLDSGGSGPGPSAPESNLPYSPAFNYNIPPSTIDPKDLNINMLDNNAHSDDNLENEETDQKEFPKQKFLGDSNSFELPSVPSDSFSECRTNRSGEDIDFDDLTRRFEELKKKK